jgi:hypothetical protein
MATESAMPLFTFNPLDTLVIGPPYGACGLMIRLAGGMSSRFGRLVADAHLVGESWSSSEKTSFFLTLFYFGLMVCKIYH